MAFNFTNSSVKGGNEVTVNLETVENYLNDFFKNFEDTVGTRFKKNMVFH